MISRFCLLLAILSSLLIFSATAGAGTAAFDLPGPRIEVRVSRDGKELPIANVPNLQEHDRLWVHPDLPQTQSAHYLLIVSFLRGSTNPPPENWFTRVECWDKRVRNEGTVVTVPVGAEQALIFLAPETGGDYSTLRSNVRGRPGAFVRASQDLNQASYDRSRLDAYLAAVKHVSDTDPSALKEQSAMLARSLNIKLDKECLDKPTEQQAPCLVQNSDQLVLDDPHSQSMVAELANGPSADLVGQLSATPMAGAGFYSAYVGAIVDVVRLMTQFHTADYQYIPALAMPAEDELNLQLNAAPSFVKPKSVLVVGLPAVEAPKPPPLRAVDPKGVYCAQNPSLLLPVDGAPLAFSTKLAHDVVLHVSSKSGQGQDLSATADAARGGFVVDTANLRDATDADLSGTLRGEWGFDFFAGPTFALRTSRAGKWTIAPADQSALVAGREDTLHLKSEAAVCAQDVIVEDASGKKLKVTHKLTGPDELQVTIPLKDATPGALTMQIKQYGLAKPDDVALHSYSEAGHLDSFALDAGDHQGVLKGMRLDEVAGVEVNGVHFAPDGLTRAGSVDELKMTAAESADVSKLKAGEKETAKVTLQDSRVLDLAATVQPPRPRVTLISKNIQPAATQAQSPIQLGSQNELPQDATLRFSLKSQTPATFPRDEMIEVATQDESDHVVLSVADGTLNLQDAQTVVATLAPVKNLGASAFGPLRYRPIGANGEKGDWQPLITLVRLPTVEGVRCPEDQDQQCTLQGTGLYLLDSVSADPQFQPSTTVPDGFAGSTLTVPRPSSQELYVKLRDDPSTVNQLIVPVQGKQ